MLKPVIFIFCFFLPLFTFTQTADFTFETSNGFFCNPATVVFTQNCTGNPIGFVWNFGNGEKGYTDQETITFTRARTYYVSLVAIYPQKAVRVFKEVVINGGVTASIGVDKNYICQPGVVNFRGAATGNVSNYVWDFGDTSGIVNAAGTDTTHNYANIGDYTVTLKVTDTTGCEDTARTLIRVMKPPIVASATPLSGCIPANVRFTSDVTLPANDFVTSYNWDYGDGSPVATTNTPNTSKRYNAVGTYLPTLNIVTNEGCSNLFSFPLIAYGTPPVDPIAYPKKPVVCGSEAPVFVAKATNANRYTWNFGDGTSAVTTDTIIGHKYWTLGTKRVTVTPYFNGCPGPATSFNIEVVGVISKFNYANTCADRKTYAFTDFSLGKVSSYVWDFGDGSPNEFIPGPRHTYPDTGTFKTSFTVTDAITGCVDVYEETIYTAKPQLLNPDSSICKHARTLFRVLDTYSDSLATYTWDVAGIKIGPLTEDAIAFNAPILGNFSNFVTINYGRNSCPDTIRMDRSLLVKGPDLKYDAPSPICLNTITTLTNYSKPFVPQDSITLMYWNYGNSTRNDTIYQPAPYQYSRRGSYSVILTAADINGCQDSLVKVIRVNQNPFLAVVPHVDTMCLGQPDTLVAYSSANVLWSPTTGLSCADCDTVAINPPVTTQYIVTATNGFNCSVQDSVIVRVFTPFTAAALPAAVYVCRNEQVKLNVEPKDKYISWSPASGLSSTTISNPVASPQQTTLYTATLRDSVGCFSDSVQVNVMVKSSPTVDAGPDRILPYNSAYTLTPSYSSNVRAYLWTPPDLLSCNDCPRPSGTAFKSETFSIKVTSDSGCVATDNINLVIECKNANLFMPGAFSPNNDNLNDTYYPITRGFQSIIRFAIFNRAGKLVYEARNIPPNSKSFGWDGYYKGEPQPATAYVYVLDALCELGERLTKSGSFMLVR